MYWNNIFRIIVFCLNGLELVPVLMPVHNFMHCQGQLMTYLEDSLLHCTMALLGDQDKNKQIFFSIPLWHQKKYARIHKGFLMEVTTLVCFFEQFNNTDHISGTLKELKHCSEMLNAKSDRIQWCNHCKNCGACHHCSHDYNEQCYHN